MKLISILLIMISTNCIAQKFEFVFALSPTYSFTGGNISYLTKPELNPTLLIEDPRSPGKFDSKSINWIQTKNYFGIEPSIEVGYRLGKSVKIGLGFFGRHRQLRYDVFLPLFGDSPNFSHSYKLDFNFVATTIGINFRNAKQDINIGLDAGFNYPLNKLDEYHTYDQIFNQFNIRESVVGQVKGSHTFTEFTLNPLVKLTINKRLNDKLDIGFSIEKQMKNEYGSFIRIIDTSTSSTILNGSVLGSDLTLGIKVGYKLAFKNKDKKK